MSHSAKKPYKIIGAYDSETTNIIDKGKGKIAFPILHQLGIMQNTNIESVTPDNVETCTKVFIYRHCVDLYAHFDRIIEQDLPFVPVIACHNLSFDMYGLSSWLSTHDVKVLAKSERKPITFSIVVDGQIKLVIWDTLIFTQKSLDYLGKTCGYEKMSGKWDYDLIRTPDTTLTDKELEYATHDIYALLAYLGYWCRVNPDISPALLGQRVVTKTGVVRIRRLQRLGKIKSSKLNKSVGKYWVMQNKSNQPKTDDELFTMNACTRGGFTFVSSVNASIPYDLDDSMRVYGYDATSQHPAQIVSHRYPDRFRAASVDELDVAAQIIMTKTTDDLLAHYDKPFPVAVNACYKFDNLRVKKGSIFDRYGIAPLASARCREYAYDANYEDNQQQAEFRHYLSENGYKDRVINGSFLFGKLVAAETAYLYVTELSLWEISQSYEWDSLAPVHGYITTRFSRPSDMAALSVMSFYEAKNAFKQAKTDYEKHGTIYNETDLIRLGIPEFVASDMKDGLASENIIASTYLGLKADLNALFGIEACNEYRRDTVLDSSGISYTGDYGICNAPKTPKAWYQMGQRIVGWSRVAQILVMQLISPFIETVVNGDTDSIKFIARIANIKQIENAIHVYSGAIDKAKAKTCTRVKRCYPQYYNSLDFIGHYVQEFTTGRYCASWNKAYVIADDNECRFTLAGIPAKRGIDQIAGAYMCEHGYKAMCNLFLGYNVTYTYDLIRLHARKFPEWGNVAYLDVQDYTGNKTRVCETESLCLYPMSKTINDTGNKENAANMKQALKNNSHVNTEPVMITGKGIVYIRDVLNNG